MASYLTGRECRQSERGLCSKGGLYTTSWGGGGGGEGGGGGGVVVVSRMKPSTGTYKAL